jgi:glycosyltransferase involved in cell wall biosynthesis
MFADHNTRTLVVAHPFALAALAGTTVLLRGLLREIPAVNPRVRTAYLNLDKHATPGVSLTRLRSTGDSVLQFLGVNLHIEQHHDRSMECFEICRFAGVPAYLWVHDYWPHHQPTLRRLVRELGVTLLASTWTVRDGLARNGFSARVVQAGIAIANLVIDPPRPPGRSPFVVGTAGRLVRRKRSIDVVRAFRLAHLSEAAQLRLRLLPSLVYPAADDRVLLAGVMEEIAAVRAAGGSVVVDLDASAQHDYGAYSAYVCASDYEGLSMTPIEAIYCGCPAFMSDIPAHREIARRLHPADQHDVLFPLGNVRALAGLLRDEALTGRRRARLWSRLVELRSVIEAHWSLRGTAKALLDALGGHDTRLTRAQEEGS